MKTGSVVFSLMLVVIVGTGAAFWPCLDNGFLHWDDQAYVTDNETIRELSWGNLKNIFSSTHTGLYVPLVILSYTLEYHFFGPDPFYYHLTNLILHILNAVLVFALVYLLCRSPGVSFWVSLLFALHPLRVESVAWVTERKDLLFSLFFLVSLVFYLLYRKRGEKKSFYYFSLLTFTLSLLSKVTAVILPALLILFDFYLRRKGEKLRILNKVAFIQLSLVFGIVGLWVLKVDQPPTALPLYDRVVNTLGGIPFYLYKIFFPFNLSPRYPEEADRMLPLPLLTTLLTVGGMILLFFLFRRSRKDLAFGLLFFFITLAPVVPLIMDGFPHGDRYTYLPSIGIFFVSVRLLAHLFKKNIAAGRVIGTRVLTVLLGGGAALFLSVLTWHQCRAWADDLSLWNQALESYPTHIVYSNRALALARKGEIQAAIHDFTRALAFKEYYEIYYNRGLAYEKSGRPDAALKDYTRSIALNPRYAPAYSHRGFIYSEMGEVPLALGDYSRALALKPANPEVYYNRALLYIGQGRLQAALRDLSVSLRLNPHQGEAYYNRGALYARVNDTARAAADFTAAIRENPSFLRPYYGLLEIYRGKKDVDKMVELCRKLLEADPHNRRALELLKTYSPDFPQ